MESFCNEEKIIDGKTYVCLLAKDHVSKFTPHDYQLRKAKIILVTDLRFDGAQWMLGNERVSEVLERYTHPPCAIKLTIEEL